MDINKLFSESLLAQAAYANNLSSDKTELEFINELLQVDGVTQAQAELIASSYTVVGQFTNSTTGFSATMFKDSSDNYHFSIRGSNVDEPVDWYDANLGNGFFGLAYNQAADMLNFYFQLTHSGTIPKFEFTVVQELSEGQIGIPVVSGYLTFIENGTQTGLAIPNLDSQKELFVSGHSLGGHLASVFTLLFPSVTTYTATYDSAGFVGVLFEDFATMINDAVNQSGVLSIAPVSVAENDVDNVRAPLDPVSLLAPESHLGGSIEDVFIEAQDTITDFESHELDRLVDSLTVINFLHTLDNSVTIESANQLLTLASNNANTSLEGIGNHLAKLFGQASIPLTNTDHDAIYTKIKNITESLGSNSYQIALATGSLAEQVASGDKAALYALINLQSFVVTGATQAITDTLYQSHANELVFADYSKQYLEDRAEMLAVKNIFYAEDIPPTVQLNSEDGDRYFHDIDSGLEFRQVDGIFGPSNVDVNQYLFGSDNAEILGELTGGNKDDHIYGGDGLDVLNGGLGDDYLEGGQGSDLYVYNSGHDTIVDSDGLGSVNWNGQPLGAVTLNLSNSHIDEAKGITYHFDPDAAGSTTGTLRIADRNNSANSSLTIKNYTLGLLGLTNVSQVEDIPDTTPTDSYIGSVGNDLILPATPVENNANTLIGLDGDDYLSGRGGNDFIDGGNGKDWLVGGDDDDWLKGGNDSDVIFTGKGIDSAYGGEGNDFILGNQLFVPETPVGDGVDNDITLVDTQLWDIIGSKFEVNYQSLAVNPDNQLEFLISTKYPDTGFNGQITDHRGVFDYNYIPNSGQFGAGSIALSNVDGDTGLYHLRITKFPIQDTDVKTLYGESGDDVLAGNQGNDWLSGGVGNDTLAGNDGNDTLLGGANDDDLLGGQGNDTLEGGLDSDQLFGEQGDDRLFGGKGNDFLWGDSEYLDVSVHGDDYLDGGEGNDQLVGGAGIDTLIGGQGEDNLFGEQGADVLEGGSENDYLDGGEGNDRLEGGLGNDTLYGREGNDTLVGGEGLDRLYGGAGDDVLTGRILDGGAGNDIYLLSRGATGSTIYNNGGGQDVLRFTDIASTEVTVSRVNNNLGLRVPATNQSFALWYYFNASKTLAAIEFSDAVSWTSSDIAALLLLGDDSDEVIEGYEGLDNIIDGRGGNDTLSGKSGNDTITGGDGDDTLFGNDGDDILNGGNGTDSIYGEYGDDTIDGGGGTDHIVGGYGNDVLSGGAGTGDVLIGDQGDDIYLFSLGDGDVAINNYNYIIDHDVLQFGEGIVATDVTIERNKSDLDVILGRTNSDLKLIIESTGESVVINSHFADERNTLNEVHFFDGTVWDSDDILQALLVPTENDDVLEGSSRGDVIDGGDGNDVIYGNNGNDILLGGKGDDTLYGGKGNDTLRGGQSIVSDILIGGEGVDTYLYSKADGDIYISDDETWLYSDSSSILSFIDLNADDIVIETFVDRLGGNDLDIYDLRFRIKETGALLEVATVFHDIYEGFFSQINFSDGSYWDNDEIRKRLAEGTENDDVLFGGVSNEILRGFGGDDELYAGDGDDILYGGAGNDVLNGNHGKDVYIGGAGNDIFMDAGFVSDSIYHFDLNWGHDYIASNLYPPQTIRFGEGIGLDDITYGYSYSNQESAYVELNERYDRYIQTSVEVPGIVITISHTETGDTIAFGRSSLAHLEFFDGSTFDLPHLTPVITTLLDDISYQPGETFEHELPIENFIGAGRLIYSITLSSGEPLPAWLTYEQTFSSYSTPASLKLVGDMGSLEGSLSLVINATDSEGYTVSDDFILTIGDLANVAPTVEVSLVDQTIAEAEAFNFDLPVGSFSDADIDDVLTYTASLSDDSALPSWLSFDAVTQTFSGTPENDDVGVLSLKVTATDTAGQSVSDNFDLTVTNVNEAPMLALAIADQNAAEANVFSFALPADSFTDADVGDVLTYSATLFDDSALPSWLSFDAVTQNFSGTPANADVGVLNLKVTAIDNAGLTISDNFDLTVNNTNDAPTLDNALLDQSANEDSVFNFAVPAGTFADVDAGDSLTYSASLADDSALPSWLSFDAVTQTFSGTPDNGDVGVLNLKVTATDIAGLSVSDSFDLSVTAAEFDISGTDEADTLVGTGAGETIVGLAGNDTIKGRKGDDVLDGGIGDDIVNGGGQNDTLFGQEGKDKLIGGNGNDLLEGGGGNDILIGSKGNDTYTFSAGFGSDKVNNNDSVLSSFDIAQFNDVSFEDLWFSKKNNHLDVTIAGTTDKVRFKNWYKNESDEIDQFEVGDSILLNNQVDQLVSAMAAYNVPSGAGNVIPQDTKDALQPILASSWS